MDAKIHDQKENTHMDIMERALGLERTLASWDLQPVRASKELACMLRK